MGVGARAYLCEPNCVNDAAATRKSKTGRDESGNPPFLSRLKNTLMQLSVELKPFRIPPEGDHERIGL